MFRLILGTGALALAVSLAPGVAAKDHPVTTLYDFATETDGYFPAVTVADRHGALYGFTINGGGMGGCPWGGCGTLFKLKPSGEKIVLHTFTGAVDDGGRPSGIVIDDDGTIYGATWNGGPENAGTVFKRAPDGTMSLLHTFSSSSGGPAPGGSIPLGPLMRGRDGNFYGTTWQGGVAGTCGVGCGTVFRVTPAGQFTTLYAFKGGSDSCTPYGGVVDDAAGNLYGTSAGCGTRHNFGTVFKLAPDGTETVLHTFTGGTDGAFPTAAPVLDDAGNLYGAADQGGSAVDCEPLGDLGPGCGAIYKISAEGAYSILYRFRGIYYGRGPSAPLYLDGKGNLYGTTTSGGAIMLCNAPWGCGTVFKIAPDGTQTVLHRFMGQDHGQGAVPQNALVPGSGRDSDYLYSTTSLGGASQACDQGCGVIFKIKK